MALNCTYTYNGKQYSESELKDLFLSGELKNLVINKSLTLSDFLFLDPKNSTPAIEEVIATVRNKKDMVSALQTVFSLPKEQAEAVAKVYDAAAQGMVNLGIYESKEEYYNNTPLFKRVNPLDETIVEDKDILFSTIKEGLDDFEFTDLMEFEDEPYRMSFNVKRNNEEVGVVEINRNDNGEFYVSWFKRTGGETGDGARILQRSMQNLINKGLPVTVDSYITSAGYAAMSKLAESGFLVKLRDEILEENSRTLKPAYYDSPAFAINPEVAVPNNQKIVFQQPVSRIVSFVEKGFELQRSTSGFGLSYKTKTGSATPELAARINKWLSDNGYNNVQFRYERTYGTLQPFYKQNNQGLLFQNEKRYSSIIASRLTSEKLLDIINRLEDIELKLQEESFDLDEYDFFSTNFQFLKESLLEDKSSTNISRIFKQLVDLQIDDLSRVLLQLGYSNNEVELLYNESTKNITGFPDFVKGSSFTEWSGNINLEDPYIEPYMLNQQAKGAIDLNKRIIYALTSPDVTTPLHEFAHLWLSDIEAAAMNGNMQANAILSVFQNFAESDEGKLFFSKNNPNQEFNPEDYRYRQELFARGFERYIADGEAPKSILEKIFDMFKKWLIDIYNGVTGSEIDIQLNEQMKSVYDQILGKKAKSKSIAKQNASKNATQTTSLVKPVVEVNALQGPKFENVRVKAPAGFENNEVYVIPISSITIDKVDSELVEKEEDRIEGTKAVINLPVVTLNTDGTFTLVSGAESAQAVKNVGYSNIPVIVNNEQFMDLQDLKPAVTEQEVSNITEEDPTKEEVETNTNEEVTPLEPINTIKVDFEPPVAFSKREVAAHNKTATLTPFETTIQEANGIKTNDLVTYKGKQYRVKSIDEEGFLTLVSADIIANKNGSLFYTRPVSKSDIEIALPQMVKVVEEITETEDPRKYDPVLRIVEKLKQLFPQIPFEIGSYQWEQAGRFQNGKVLINKRTLTKDTPIHEFLHPFVYSIRITSPQLYNSLITDLQSEEGKKVVREIVNDPTYKSLTKEEILDEAIVRLMSRDITDVFDDDGNINEEKLNQKKKSFTDSLKELFNYLMDLIFGTRKNTNINNFINIMNKDSQLKDKFLFKASPLGTSRSKIDTLSLNNKTIIYINPKYFTPTTIVDNLFYDIQQDLSENDYKLILNKASEKIKLTNSSNKRNPVAEVTYKRNKNRVDIKRYSISTGKYQQQGFDVESVEDISQFLSPDEYDYFISEYNNISDTEDVVTITNIHKHIISLKDNPFVKTLKVQDIPVNLTIGQLADFIITQNISVEYTQGEIEAIGKITAYSTKLKKATPASSEVKNAVKKLQDRVRNLKDTGDRRIKNPSRDKSLSLTREANALEAILKNQNEAEGLLEYIRQGVVSLQFALQNMGTLRHDFYDKINSGNITTDEINEFNRKFKEISTYFTYYSNLSYLTNKFEPLFYETLYAKEAKAELEQINTVLAKVEYAKKNFQTLVTDMVTEWLFPHYYNQMNIIAERNKNLPSVVQKKIEGIPYIKYGNGNFSIDKEALKKNLRNQLIRADEDASFVTHLLGSTISSRDPVNAISSMVITDAIYENDYHVDRLWVVLNRQYENFLKNKNLPDDEKQLREWYKKNYLRQALVYEKTGRNADGSIKYEYVPRWAYHQDKFYDLIDRDLREFAKTLPVAKTAKEYTANKDLLNDKRKQLEADPKYINPAYQPLVKDDYYMLLYKNYELSNSHFGNNALKFGVIGQVNTKKSPSQAVKETVSSIKEKAQEVAKEDSLRKKVKNVTKSTVDYLFDRDESIDNMEYNFDDSLYRNIRTSTLIPIENEEDLELLLHENVMVFTKDALKYSSLRDIQSNIDNLKYLIQGNPSLGINPRKVISLDKKGNNKWFNFIRLPKHKEQYQNRLNDQLVKQINDVVYGESEEEANIRFGQSRDEKGNLVGGANISLNKLGSNLGFGTALLNMAGNLLSMTRNITIGNVTNFMEAIGSRYVSKEDYAFATAEYGRQIFNSTDGILKDAFSRRKSKIAQMALLYDAIQGEYRDREGRIITENFTRRYYSRSSWFLLNHAAEHQIQLTMMVALMKARKVQTKDGKTISLWDAYDIDQNGVYTISPNVVWNAKEVSDFRKEMHSILRELNGNYSELHKSVLQRSWWGKLLLVYRKYIYSQVRSRFGGFRMDYERGDIAYGYFRMFMKQLIADVREVGVGQALANVGKNLKNNEEKTYLNYATRKTVFELATLTGLLITIKALAPDDDENETSKLNAYALWWLNSLYSDLGSYTFQSLAEVGRQVKNPSAGNITLTKMTAFADQLLSDITSGELERYEQDGYGYEKGDTKLGTKLEKLVPIVNQIHRAANPEQQLQFFDLIGKKVRTD